MQKQALGQLKDYKSHHSYAADDKTLLLGTRQRCHSITSKLVGFPPGLSIGEL